MEQSYDPERAFTDELRGAHDRTARDGCALLVSFTLRAPTDAPLNAPTPAAIFLAFLHGSPQRGVRTEVHEHQLGVHLLRALSSSGAPPETSRSAATFLDALVTFRGTA